MPPCKNSTAKYNAIVDAQERNALAKQSAKAVVFFDNAWKTFNKQIDIKAVSITAPTPVLKVLIIVDTSTRHRVKKPVKKLFITSLLLNSNTSVSIILKVIYVSSTI